MNKGLDKLFTEKNCIKILEISDKTANPKTLFKIGKFLFDNGRFDESIKCFDKIFDSHNTLAFELCKNFYGVITVFLLTAGVRLYFRSIFFADEFNTKSVLLIFCGLILAFIWNLYYVIIEKSLFYLALASAHLGDFKSSLLFFNSIINKNTFKNQKNIEDVIGTNSGYNYAAGYTARGQVLREYDVNMALQDFEKAIKISPDYIEAYIQMEIIYCDVFRDYDKAEKLITQILEKSSKITDYSACYLILALINKKKNPQNTNKILEFYAKAIDIQPCAKTYSYRAEYYFEQGDYLKALSDFDTCIQYDPDTCKLYLDKCNCYIHLKEFDKAKQTIELAKAKGCDKFDEYLLFGNIYKEVVEYEKSLEYYKKVLEITPEDPKIYFNIVWLESKLGNYKNALEYVSKAIRINRKMADSYYVRGYIYYKTKQYKKSYKDFQKSFKLGGKTEDCYIMMATILVKLNKIDEAINKLEELLRIRPDIDKSEYYFSYGQIFIEVSPNVAIEKFNTSLKYNPNKNINYLNIAIAYLNLKNFELAQKYFDEFSKELPSNYVLKAIIFELKILLLKDKKVSVEEKEKITEWIGVLESSM